MQKEFKEVYEQIKMSEECSRRIMQAMQNKAENATEKMPGYWQRSGFAFARAFALVVAVLFLLADGTVYAYTGEGIISRVVSFAGNAVFTQGVDEKGNHVSTASLDTTNATAPAEFREGRLCFTANGECIDITDLISEKRAYIYDYKDNQGITHYLIVGGNPETFGYAEFTYDETQSQGWIGGYFQSGKVGESITPDWLQNAKKELKIPWP